jgi:hypothetical protein
MNLAIAGPRAAADGSISAIVDSDRVAIAATQPDHISERIAGRCVATRPAAFARFTAPRLNTVLRDELSLPGWPRDVYASVRS